MKEKTIKGIIVVALATVFFVVIGQYILNKYLKTMLLSKLVPFIQEKEGGLSRDPGDNASAYPAPWTYDGHDDWHTNKGITYQTFKSNAKRLGYEPSAKNFFEMPDSIWLNILKNVYMSAYPLHRIDHLPRIQAVIIT